jgi:hypothetical protein
MRDREISRIRFIRVDFYREGRRLTIRYDPDPAEVSAASAPGKFPQRRERVTRAGGTGILGVLLFRLDLATLLAATAR